MHPVSLPVEVLCGCGKWHRLRDFREIARDTSVYTSWNAVYRAPCGRRYSCHGGDPASDVRPLYLEDYFERKRVSVIPDSAKCPRCRKMLTQDPEGFWDAWQWASGRGVEIHVRQGLPGS